MAVLFVYLFSVILKFLTYNCLMSESFAPSGLLKITDLSKFVIACQGNTFLENFILTQSGNSYYYTYTCSNSVSWIASSTTTPTTTAPNDAYGFSSNPTNSLLFLDRHSIICGDNQVIKSVRLVADSYSTIHYEWTCAWIPGFNTVCQPQTKSAKMYGSDYYPINLLTNLVMAPQPYNYLKYFTIKLDYDPQTTQPIYSKGYIYYNYNICKFCDPNCQDCSAYNPYSCTSCAPGYYPLVSLPSYCYLKNTNVYGYFFDSSTNVFKKCESSCKFCNSSQRNCTTCVSYYYPVLNNYDICYLNTVQVPYYYFETDSFKKCDTSCKQCGGPNPGQCQTCNDNYYPLEDNASSCHLNTESVPFYVFNDTQSQFLKCDVSCTFCTRPGFGMCSSCNSNYAPLVDKSTNCYSTDQLVQYYKYSDTDKKFLKCDSKCLYCSGFDTDQCTTCNTNYYYPVADRTGVCRASTEIIPYYVYSSVDMKFLKCHISCSSCSGPNPGECLNCNNTYYPLPDNSKKCYLSTEPVPGYTYNTDKQQFLICDKSCKYCDSVNLKNCTTCAPTYFPLVNNSSSCHTVGETIPYYLDVSNIFKPCFQFCAECANNSTCITCQSNYYLLPDSSSTCYSAPPKNYSITPVGKVFPKCDSSCLTCNGTASNNCLTCQSNLFYLPVNKTCLISCPDGYYSDTNKICQKCDLSCYTCINNSTNCTLCNTDYYKIGPVSPLDNRCYNSSPSGYYLDSRARVYSQCIPPCANCESYSECSSCIPFHRFFSSNKTCDSNCPDGTFWNSNGTVCLKCSPECSTCTFNSTSCTQCSKGYFNNPISSTVPGVKYSCVVSCPSGFYPDSNNTCTRCFDLKMVSHDNTCLSECPTGYYPNANLFCKTCQELGKYILDDGCVATCPTGYTVNKTICSKDPVIQTNTSSTSTTNSSTTPPDKLVLSSPEDIKNTLSDALNSTGPLNNQTMNNLLQISGAISKNSSMLTPELVKSVYDITSNYFITI